MVSLQISQFPFTSALVLLIGGRRLEAKSVIVEDSETTCACYPDQTQLSNGTWDFGLATAVFIPFFTFRFAGSSPLVIAATLALFAGSAVQAATYNVDVGASGLTFTPTNIIAASGDSITFTFLSGAHTVTQSTFANPCTALAGGIDSGPMPVAGDTSLPTYNYIVNGTSPAWFYCKTGQHCKFGMVFAVNPTTQQTYDAFKSNAVNGTAPAAPSGSAPGPTGNATTPSTSSGTSDGSVSSLILEPSVTSIVNDASSTSNTNIGAIVGGVVAAVIVLMLGVVLLWYFKYRGRKISQRSRPPVQPYDPDPTGSGAHPDLQMATGQGALPSHFYGSSDTASQVAYKSTQTGRTPVPQQAVPSHKTVFHSNPFGDDEPVEAGLMSTEMSTSGVLPLYGPGAV